jgi:glycosyltransferase involved in cell wall biosynthesis
MLTKKISVVMPAYNEAAHIVSNLLETIETLTKYAPDFEVIVVDDGSPDETYREAAKLLSSQAGRVRIVQYDENQGKGNALMCGAWFALGELVVFMDADMDLHPAQLPVFFEIMERTGADIVIGSKRHRLSKVNYPRMRRIYSAIYYAMIRLMFGLPVKDTQTGLKVFKREVLQRVFPRILAKRFAFDIEVLANAHRLGFKMVDAPVTLEFQRRFGRIKWRDIVAVMTDTLAIFYRMYILKYYDRFDVERLNELPLSCEAREVLEYDVVGRR